MRVQATWSGWRGPSGRFQTEAPRALDNTLASLRASLLAIARREAPEAAPGSQPPGSRPGRLRAELRAVIVRQGASGTLTLDSPTPYARYVLQGRGPIEAKRGRVLAFWVGGRLIFRRRVGPAKANPFIERAFDQWEPIARGTMRQLVGRWAALLTADD